MARAGSSQVQVASSYNKTLTTLPAKPLIPRDRNPITGYAHTAHILSVLFIPVFPADLPAQAQLHAHVRGYLAQLRQCMVFHWNRLHEQQYVEINLHEEGRHCTGRE